MSKRIYIGNLAFSVTESSINELFSQHGTVDSFRLITDRDTGRPKGFGFLEMSTDGEADKAISSLNGHELDGRALTVNEARSRVSQSTNGATAYSRPGFGGGRKRVPNSEQRPAIKGY